MVLIEKSNRRFYHGATRSFRPLTGIMVLIDWQEWANKYAKQCDVSVPLRGLWFLSYELDKEIDMYKDEFPSPYGDYGSYHAVQKTTSIATPDMFPSPYGDYGSYRNIL